MDVQKGLNLDSNPKALDNGEWTYARNIMYDDLVKAIVNETGNVPRNKEGIDFIGEVVGVIEYAIGELIFTTERIYWYEQDELKLIMTHGYSFSTKHPVRGITSYNWKKELLVYFSDGVEGDIEPQVINVGEYYEQVKPAFEVTIRNKNDLFLDVLYPMIVPSVVDGGTLESGTYYVAIAYRDRDGSYTEFSPVSPSIYVFDNYQDGGAGSITSKRIKLNITHFQDSLEYTKFRLSVIYNDGITNIVRYSEDYDYSTGSQEIYISSIKSFLIGSLEEVIVSKVHFNRVEVFTSVYNELELGNLKSQSVSDEANILKEVAKNMQLAYAKESLSTLSGPYDYILNHARVQGFQHDEVYALYLNGIDNKGKVIATVPIELEQSQIGEIIRVTNTNNEVLYKIPPESTGTGSYFLHVGQIYFGLPDQSIINPILEDSSMVSFFVSAAIRTNSNSRIICQGFAIPNNTRVGVRDGKIDSPLSTVINTWGDNGVSLGSLGGANSGYNLYAAYLDGAREDLDDKQKANNNIGEIADAIFRYNFIKQGQTNAEMEFRFYSLEGLYSQSNLPESNVEFLGRSDLYFDWAEMWTAVDTAVKWNGGDLSSFRESQRKRLLVSEGILYSTRRTYPAKTAQYILNNNATLYNLEQESYNQLIVTIPNAMENVEVVDTKRRYGKVDDSTYVIDYARRRMWMPTGVEKEFIENISRSICRVNLISKNTDFYNSVYDQQIQTVSPIVHKTYTGSVKLKGDIFYGYNYIRKAGYLGEYSTVFSLWAVPFADLAFYTYNAATFSEYSNAIAGTLTTSLWNTPRKAIPFLWIMGLPTESKSNLAARWSGQATYQKQYRHDEELSPLFDYNNYPTSKDNFINTVDGFGYDKVFHAVSDLNAISPTTEEQVTYALTHMYNRIARSYNKSAESISDNWRYFNAASYHDMPVKFGEIINMHSVAKSLYIQQRFAQHIAAIKDVLTYDAGGTAIGSSDLFDRLPEEIASSRDGYIGCINYFSSCVCEMGVLTIDADQSKIFLTNGSQIEEINLKKIEQWLKGKLYKEDRYDVDGNVIKVNPFEDRGAIFIYDKPNRRFIVSSKYPNDPDRTWTLTYDFIGKRWVSFHDYLPSFGWYNRLGSYMYRDQGDTHIYKQDRQNRAIYFGIKHPSWIQLIYNEAYLNNKIIESLTWDTSMRYHTEESILNLYDETFNSILVHNDTQCTDYIDVVSYNNPRTSWFDNANGVYKESLWHWNNIRDKVKDNRKPFLKKKDNGYIEVIDTNIDHDREFFNDSRFIGQYISVTFTYNNPYYNELTQILTDDNPREDLRQPEFIIHDVEVNAMLDNRIEERQMKE